MKTIITIRDPRGSRELAATDFPLSVGGTRPDIEVPGLRTPEPIAHLGLADGDLFIQPSETGPALFCNGNRVSTSQWLRDGDVVRLGGARLVTRMAGQGLQVEIAPSPEEAPAPMPTLAPPETAGREGPAAGTPIQPIAFEPSRVLTETGIRQRFDTKSLLLWLGLASLSAATWFVFTATSIQLEFEPTPDRVDIEGRFPVFNLGDRHLLRPGDYTITASKHGFQPLQAPLHVSDRANQSFRFALEKLPGRLAVSTPVEGAAVFLDDERIGETPLDAVEVSAGNHEVVVRKEGYGDFSATIDVEGAGRLTTLDVELSSRWATITFRSEPPGATVVIDGRRVGVTPVTTDLIEGARSYAVTLAGHKIHRGRLNVVAGEARTLPTVRLEPQDGRLRVRSRPSGANVTVDGVFHGQAPLDLDVTPGERHEVTLSRLGYETEIREVRLGSGKEETLTVTLTARLGQLEIITDPPDADLYVNGDARGSASQVVELPSAPQKIEIKKPGYEPYTTTVTPRPGFPQSIEVVLRTLEDVRAAARKDVMSAPQGHELRLVTPRRLLMGASRREPGRRANESLREVELKRHFYLGKTEVSNRQFRAFDPKHRSGSVRSFNLETDHHPVVNVTWEDAARYCNWLSEQASLPPFYIEKDGALVARAPATTGYRLPTEAEWAAAARLPDGENLLKYAWGNALPVPSGAGNYADESAKALIPTTLPGYSDGHAVTAPVEGTDPNPLGLFHLSGNVAEWVHDRYTIHPSRETRVARDPLGPEEGEFHVIRGASWMHGTVTRLRLSYRDYGKKARPDVGFRLARYAD